MINKEVEDNDEKLNFWKQKLLLLLLLIKGL